MCKEFEDLIDLYVAGDLEPEEAREVEDHLAGCEACSKEASSYRACLGTLASLSSENQPDRLSPFFWQGIQKEILLAQEQQVAPARSKARRVLYALAAAILIAVVAYVARGLVDPGQTIPNAPVVVKNATHGDEGVILPPDTPYWRGVDPGNVGSREYSPEDPESGNSIEF
jgi:hypothetical protein